MWMLMGKKLVVSWYNNSQTKQWHAVRYREKLLMVAKRNCDTTHREVLAIVLGCSDISRWFGGYQVRHTCRSQCIEVNSYPARRGGTIDTWRLYKSKIALEIMKLTKLERSCWRTIVKKTISNLCHERGWSLAGDDGLITETWLK